MKMTSILVSLVVCVLSGTVLAGELPSVANISGPCLLIDGDRCYNRYEQDGKEVFGVHSFSAERKNVLLFETVDCTEAVKDTSGIYFYHSKKVRGLKGACSAAEVKAALNGKPSHQVTTIPANADECAKAGGSDVVVDGKSVACSIIVMKEQPNLR